jgi:hypothetical protein
LKSFLKIILALFASFLSFTLGAQEEPQTFKVRKEQDILKAFFESTDMKLLVIDRFGNPKDNKIVSYKLWIKEKKVKHLDGFDNSLTNEMVKALNKQKSATKIFFTEIKVKDDEGHLQNLPDVIELWFPDCRNCGDRKRR